MGHVILALQRRKGMLAQVASGRHMALAPLRDWLGPLPQGASAPFFVLFLTWLKQFQLCLWFQSEITLQLHVGSVCDGLAGELS